MNIIKFLIFMINPIDRSTKRITINNRNFYNDIVGISKTLSYPKSGFKMKAISTQQQFKERIYQHMKEEENDGKTLTYL